MARIFTAIDLPESTANEVASKQHGLSGANWEDHPHITLVHFGDVVDGDVERVGDALLHVAFDGFDLRPTKLGFFGEANAPFVMWIGLAASEALDDLHEELLEIRSRFTSVPERNAFTPHITLARTNGVDRADLHGYTQQLDLSTVGGFAVREFHLYESVNYTYRRIATIPAND